MSNPGDAALLNWNFQNSMSTSLSLANDTRHLYEGGTFGIMDSQQPLQQNAEPPKLNALGLLIARLAEYGHNASNNIQTSFTRMTTQHWLRLVIIVGGYMLLRPYVLKYSTKFAVKKMEEQDAFEKQAEEEAAKISPNDLRGLKTKLAQEEDVDEGADGSSADWGSKARLRQRKMLRQLLEAEEQRRLDEEEDAELKDLLED